MSLATLPLSYCTNVHPARTVAEVIRGLDTYTGAVRKQTDRPLAAGLWLPEAVIRELRKNPQRLEHLREALARNDVVCYTLNAFPYGDFHGERVKETVYQPDWSTDERLEYTLACAAILSELLPDGVEGSLSTLPLGFKPMAHGGEFTRRCIAQLLAAARRLDELHDETGVPIRLAVEPEPLCVLETTVEVIAFFEALRAAAVAEGCTEVARRHLGVCYDVCHQSVEFEDVAASIAALQQADVRINKVHITCALRLEDPARNAAGRRALSEFAEPRYLHQTFARHRTGRVVSRPDLDAALCASPPTEFLEADEWRVHFHVPVNAERLGPLQTTRPDLERALQAVARLDYAPHLEVETYTWGVLPGRERPLLVEGLSEELRATRELLARIAAR